MMLDRSIVRAASPSVEQATKPRLVFFQAHYAESLPEFLVLHAREHVRCLSQTFDVQVIDRDCDYRRVCDEYEPDLVLFETGPNILTKACRRPRVTGVAADRSVPKLAFINADAWGETRAGIVADMEAWDVDAAFSICTTIHEHLPEMAAKVFVWPNFIDADVFRDYGEPKELTLFLTGSTALQYPWRRRVFPILSAKYPVLASPHPGYLAKSASAPTLFGESYARTINRARLVPTCGTIANELVRKHLEVPACRSCLVTEQTSALDAAGFRDMENCVYVDETNVADKVAHLLEHPEELRRITDAGFELVHARHTLRERGQILQWFRLHKDLKRGQRIVQPDPMGALLVTREATVAAFPSHAYHLALLWRGDERLLADDCAGAEQLYRECQDHLRRFPEARLRLAICSLRQGNGRDAERRIFDLLQYTLGDYKARRPDPLEAAWYLLSFLGQGRLRRAARIAKDLAWLRHPVLDRARWIVAVANGQRDDVARESANEPADPSGYIPLNATPDAWWRLVCDSLRACGQGDLAKTVEETHHPQPTWNSERAREPRRTGGFRSLQGPLLFFRARQKLGRLAAAARQRRAGRQKKVP